MVCLGSGGEAVFWVPHTSFLRVGSPLVILSETSRRFFLRKSCFTISGRDAESKNLSDAFGFGGAHPACPEPREGVLKGEFSAVVILSEESRRFLSPEIVPSDFRSGRAVEESLRRFSFYGCRTPHSLAVSCEGRLNVGFLL